MCSQVLDPRTWFLEYKLHMDKDHMCLITCVSLCLKVGGRFSTNTVWMTKDIKSHSAVMLVG